MGDLVTRIWSGPFQAHATDPTGQLKVVEIGEEIQVTAVQADENPRWYAPIPSSTPTAKPSLASVPEFAEAA